MDWKRILILFVFLITVSTEAKVILDASVHECRLEKSSLYCYFENSVIQEVHLEPLNNTIERIYIQDVNKLHMDESVCTNVFFNNITEILTAGEKDEQCKDGFDLLARKSSLNKIPENVKNVSLEFSNITSLATDRSLEELSVKNSIIEVLRISGPFENNSKVVLEGSRIVKTEKLILDDGSEFIVKDSIFVEVPDDSILLHPNARRDVVRVSGDYKYDDLVIYRKNQDLPANNSNKDFGSYIVGGVFIGVFLLIVLVFIVRYMRSHKKPQNKFADADSGVNGRKSTNLSEETKPILCSSDQNGFSSSQESSVYLDMTRSESEQSEPQCQEPNDEESKEENQSGNKGRASPWLKSNYPEGEHDSHELLEIATERRGNKFDKKPLVEGTKDTSLTLNDTGTHYMKEKKEIKLTDPDELQSNELLNTVSHQNALMETKASRYDNENNEEMSRKEIEEDIEYIYNKLGHIQLNNPDEDIKLNKSKEENTRHQIILEDIFSKLRHHCLNNPDGIRTIDRKKHSISDILKTSLSNQNNHGIKTDEELTNCRNPDGIKTSSNETIISECNNKTGNKLAISGDGDDVGDKQLDLSSQRNVYNRFKPKEKNPEQISTNMIDALKGLINDGKKYLVKTQECLSKSIIDADTDKNKIKCGEDHQIDCKKKIDGVNRQIDTLEEIFNALMTIKSINPEKVIKIDDIILVKLSKESGYIEIKDQEDFIKFLNKNEIKISAQLWNKLGGKASKKLIHQDE